MLRDTAKAALSRFRFCRQTHPDSSLFSAPSPELWRWSPHRPTAAAITNVFKQQLAAAPSRGPRSRGRSNEHDTCNHLTRLLIARHPPSQPPGNSIDSTANLLSSSFSPQTERGKRKLAGHVSPPSSSQNPPPRIPFLPTAMASNEPAGPELETDVEYISTPAAEPSKFAGPDPGVRITKVS